MKIYDRSGNRITWDEYIAIMSAGSDPARVALDNVKIDGVDARVSTVWLGINHNHTKIGPPEIFETMIFAGGHDKDTWLIRYGTGVGAKIGHDAVVSMLRAGRWPA